jgi:hypothetical protein
MGWTKRAMVVVVALMALGSLGAAAAGAVTWHNSGDTAFTATGGAITMSVGANPISCTGMTMTGTTGPSPFVGAAWTAATGTLIGSPCTQAGVSYLLTCSYQFTAVVQTGPDTVGVTHLNCVWGLASGTTLCRIQGTTPMTYLNPAPPAKGRFTLTTSSSGLTMSNITSCIWGTGTVHLSHTTLVVTSGTGGGGNGPVITRTS